MAVPIVPQLVVVPAMEIVAVVDPFVAVTTQGTVMPVPVTGSFTWIVALAPEQVALVPETVQLAVASVPAKLEAVAVSRLPLLRMTMLLVLLSLARRMLMALLLPVA